MQINIKHFIAIGLGIGVAAAYCLHLGSGQEKRIAFGLPVEGLQTLSNNASSDPNIPTPDVVDPANFAKLQHSIPELLADQKLFENDFAPPEPTTNSEDSFTLLPAMLIDARTSEPGFIAGSASDIDPPKTVDFSNETSMANVAESAGSPSLPVNKNHADFGRIDGAPLSWNGNPSPSTGSNVHVTYNVPQSVRSLQDHSSQTAAPLKQSDDLRVQEDSMSQEGRDSNLESERSTSDFINNPPVRAHQQNSLVQPEIDATAITPIRIGLTLAAAQQAVQHIEYGKSLSRRGAVFAARQEFFLALSIVAQSKDESAGGREFSRALMRGFLALKETEGFVLDNVEAGTMLDVASVVGTHRSNAVTMEQAGLLSPVQATQMYVDFAQHQLDYACGRNVVSAEAFFCLGKLYTAVSKTQSVPSNLDTAKSIVFHQSALQSDAKNHRSSNELGVLMAQTGRLQEATSYFKQSLIVKRTPQAWMNLAKTHRRLGETEFAALAESEFMLASQALVNATSAIQWIPTENFNALAPKQFQHQVASKPNGLPKTSNGQNKLKSVTKSLSDQLKKLF